MNEKTWADLIGRELDGEIVKCWKAEPVEDGEGRSGAILSAGKDGVVVACAEGALRLMEVQRPGRRRAAPHEVPPGREVRLRAQ